jgi:hypothetical protein
LIAHAIAYLSFFRKVPITVDLNDQLQLHAAKVDGVRWNGMLAPKFLIADLAIANRLPKGGRKLIGTATLIPGELNGLRRSRSAALLHRIWPPHAPSSPALLPQVLTRLGSPELGVEGSQNPAHQFCLPIAFGVRQIYVNNRYRLIEHQTVAKILCRESALHVDDHRRL